MDRPVRDAPRLRQRAGQLRVDSARRDRPGEDPAWPRGDRDRNRSLAVGRPPAARALRLAYNDGIRWAQHRPVARDGLIAGGLQALSSLTSLATSETVCCAASAIITRASSIAIMGGVMTYCLGILLPSGLVLACDSRSNAGVDQVAQVRKLERYPSALNRFWILESAEI